MSLKIFFSLKSILSDMSIATPAFFWFLSAWNIFFHLLTFNLYVSLEVRWVSWRQHIYGSCFCIHLASLCLLVGAFHPLTFNVIIDMYVLITILLVALNLFLLLFFLPLFSPLVVWWLSLVLYLSWFFLFVCVLIVDFWFAGILKLWYESIYIWDCFKLFVSIAIASPVSAFVPSSFHDFWFWWHNCAWMILYLYCIYTFTGEPCHLWNFCFLLLSFLFCLEKCL